MLEKTTLRLFVFKNRSKTQLAIAWEVSDIDEILTVVVRHQCDPSAHSFLTASFSDSLAKIIWSEHCIDRPDLIGWLLMQTSLMHGEVGILVFLHCTAQNFVNKSPTIAVLSSTYVSARHAARTAASETMFVVKSWSRLSQTTAMVEPFFAFIFHGSVALHVSPSGLLCWTFWFWCCLTDIDNLKNRGGLGGLLPWLHVAINSVEIEGQTMAHVTGEWRTVHSTRWEINREVQNRVASCWSWSLRKKC